MAQNLEYRIVTRLDDASANQVRKQLNNLGEESGSPSGSATAQKKATKETAVELDRLAREYEKVSEKLVELKAKQEEYKTQLNELKKAKRENGTLTAEQARQEAGLDTALKDVNAQYANQRRELIAVQTSNDTAGNSYKDMQARMRELSVSIRNTQDPLGRNKVAVKQMTAEYQRLNQKLKEIDGSMGNHQRNVGDYENSIRGAANAIAIFQGPLGPLSGRINSIATVLSRFSQRQREVEESTGKATIALRIKRVLLERNIPLIKTASISNTALGKSAIVANMGIKTLNIGLFALRAALISTGIGALVIALISLMQYFTRGEEGAERLRVRMAGLRAIVDTLREVLIGVGKTLADMWDDPQQGVKDLANLIKNNLWNRVKAIGDSFSSLGSIIKGAFTLDRGLIEQGMKGMVDAAIQFGTGIEDGTDRAAELLTQMRENRATAEGISEEMNLILRAEREIGVERANQNRDLQRAREFARELNEPYEDRINLLQQARQAENELAERELTLQRYRLAQMEKEVDMFTSSAEELQEVADQREKIAQMERDSAQRNMSLIRDITAVERQRDEFALRSLRNILTESERATELRIAQVEREMTQRGEMVELAIMRQRDFEERMELEKIARIRAYTQEYRNQRFSDEEAARMARQRAEQELELELLELSNSVEDAKLQRANATVDAQIEYERLQRQRQFDAQIHSLQQRNDQVGILEQQLSDTILRQEDERSLLIEERRQELNRNGIKGRQALEMAQTQVTAEQAAEREEIERNLTDARMDYNMKMMDGIANLTKNALSAIFGDNKSAAIASAIIDTYAGATKALASAPPPLNFVNAAAVVAAGIANVRKIASTTQKSTSVSGSTPSAPRTSEQFALVDTANAEGNLMSSTRAIAENQSARSSQPNVNVTLDGEFDPQFLSIKVRQGNNAISSQGVFQRKQG